MKALSFRLYLWLVCYAPRWIVRRLPAAWRARELRTFLARVSPKRPA